MALALTFGLLYTLPNFFGEAPAVQVSGAKATVKVDQEIAQRVDRALELSSLKNDGAKIEGASIRVRLPDTDTQLKARDAIEKALNADPQDPRYVVALNLIGSTLCRCAESDFELACLAYQYASLAHVSRS
ncbi:MAG: protein translocase subunit SecD [Pseudomonadota bacterium]